MSETPMMRQYREAKEACGDALLLFRMGDFYELFGEDAKVAARVLQLSLTSRDKGENPLPMAGFPHHQLDNYLAKIVKAGHRAAICDQVEDPKHAKGIVKREITRVVTAGTLTDEALLDPRASNYLAAVCLAGRKNARIAGVAWVELSTGQFLAADFPQSSMGDELARIAPSECLLSEETQVVEIGEATSITRLPDWSFSRTTTAESLTRHFETEGLAGFGFDDAATPCLRAAGAILGYLEETQRSALSHIERLIPYDAGGRLRIDQSTRRSLELSRSMRDGSREGTLLSVMDKTVTSMGARLLASWLESPLTDRAEIEARLDAVEEFYNHQELTEALRARLGALYDLERLIGRSSTGRATPRDLECVAASLAALPALKAKLAGRASKLLAEQERRVDLCEEVRANLEGALAEGCPLTAKDGGVIRSGYDAALDKLRDLATGGKQWIAEYQAEQTETSGIPSLKVGFNRVFGYYLEVTHAHRDKVPEHFIRKQTLKNAERYVTPELKEHEEKVLAAEERANALEFELFLKLREQVRFAGPRILRTARALACIDVLVGLARLARDNDYARPRLGDEPKLEIVSGRHPVLDASLPSGAFVPNHCRMMPDDSRLVILTGPNMAGKSTYIRQIALISIMGQMGSYVPAAAAEIGIADQVFARVGASDDLARGQSTFMVEMTETARILNNATERSIVVLDEIGRGTSTFDGLAVAWSVAEYLHDRTQCRTLFATHYHELTILESSLAGAINLNVAVEDNGSSVVFLHRIAPGAAAGSYGLHVAQMAGMPRVVTTKAGKILARLEADHGMDAVGRPSRRTRGLYSSAAASAGQLSLFDSGVEGEPS